MSNLQKKKKKKYRHLCSNSLIKTATVIKLYEVTNYLHAASDILTREAVLWDLTSVNLLWSGGGEESDLFVLQKKCRSGSYERAFTTLPVMENQ